LIAQLFDPTPIFMGLMLPDLTEKNQKIAAHRNE